MTEQPHRGITVQIVRFGILGGLVGLLVVVLFITPLGAQLWTFLRDPSAERLRLLLAPTMEWMPLVIVALMILHTLVPVPAELLAVVAGRLLGPFWGFVTIWIGAMLGAYFGWYLARACGLPLLQRLVAPARLQRAQNWLQRIDIPLLLAVRLLPVISFNLVNFVLGLTKITWWQFTWTTGLGIVPVTAFVVIFGANLHDWRVVTLMTLAALVVSAGGYFFLRWRSTGAADSTESQTEQARR